MTYFINTRIGWRTRVGESHDGQPKEARQYDRRGVSSVGRRLGTTHQSSQHRGSSAPRARQMVGGCRRCNRRSYRAQLMTDAQLPAPADAADAADRLLTAARFQQLAEVPPEIEWIANLGDRATRRAYEAAIGGFMRFAGYRSPRGIPWRDARARHCLARRPGPPCARRQHGAASPGGAVVAVRISVRAERRHP